MGVDSSTMGNIWYTALSVCDHRICISLGLGIRTDTGCIDVVVGRKDGVNVKATHRRGTPTLPQRGENKGVIPQAAT